MFASGSGVPLKPVTVIMPVAACLLGNGASRMTVAELCRVAVVVIMITMTVVVGAVFWILIRHAAMVPKLLIVDNTAIVREYSFVAAHLQVRSTSE